MRNSIKKCIPVVATAKTGDIRRAGDATLYASENGEKLNRLNLMKLSLICDNITGVKT